jgi:hypothetical protein
MRARMWANVAIPEDLLQAAISRLRKHVDAKKTLHFTHQGSVVEQVDVDDHQTQQAAVDKILSMSGAYVKKEEKSSSTPQVSVTVDMQTGVMRLEVGSGSNESTTPALDAHDVSISDSTVEVSGDAVPPFGAMTEPAPPVVVTESDSEAPPEIIKIKKGGLPLAVYRVLFGDGDRDKDRDS